MSDLGNGPPIAISPQGEGFLPPHSTPPFIARGKLAPWKGFWPSWHGSVENFTMKEPGWHGQNPSAAAVTNSGQVSYSMSINHSPPGLATVDGHCRDPWCHHELPNDFPIPLFLLFHLLESIHTNWSSPTIVDPEMQVSGPLWWSWPGVGGLDRGDSSDDKE